MTENLAILKSHNTHFLYKKLSLQKVKKVLVLNILGSKNFKKLDKLNKHLCVKLFSYKI